MMKKMNHGQKKRFVGLLAGLILTGFMSGGLILAVVGGFGVGERLLAQSSASGDPVSSMAAPSAESPSIPKPLETQRRNRPPRPSQELEDLQFPPDFLTLSKPASESPERAPTLGSELTTLEKRLFNADPTLWGMFLGGGFFLLYLWSDARYRQWLETIFDRNNRLLAGEDISVELAEGTVPAGLIFAGGNGPDLFHGLMGTRTPPPAGVEPFDEPFISLDEVGGSWRG